MIHPTKTIAPLAAILLAGCAASPSAIQPAMVSTARYDNASCDMLREALEAEEQTLETASSDQRKARGWDIALNLLLIPGLGAVTPDSEEAVAESKGRILAIQDEMLRRC